MENVQKRNLSNPYNTFSTICETFSRREGIERRYGSLLFPSRYAPDISGLAQIIARGLDGRSGPVSIELTTISSKVQRRIDEVVTQMLSSKRRINLATRDGVDQWNAKHGIFYPNSLGELEYVLAMNEGVMVHGSIPDVIFISDALSEKYEGFPK
ncbi:MAG: hypothetical protein HHAS10_00580 [Candidatus Altimarinota bacterium]